MGQSGDGKTKHFIARMALFNVDIEQQGMEKEKNLECHQNLFWQSKNILACNFLFCLAIQVFFGVPVPLSGLPFGTWHAAILCPEQIRVRVYLALGLLVGQFISYSLSRLLYL